MNNYYRNNRGVALILTILVIGLLVSLTLQFNKSAWVELHGSTNTRDSIRLGYIARSGINYAMAILSKDGSENSFDSLKELWADSKIISSSSTSMFPEGRFDVGVEDLERKIHINNLIDKNGDYVNRQKELLQRFLSAEEFNLNQVEVTQIINAIKDWIDSDNKITNMGAENSYYESLEKPYPCRNGPLRSIEELLFIKGITEKLFYGTSSAPGIRNYVTIHGTGKVNINTADPLILRSLSDSIDNEMALRIITFRENENNNLKDPKWYTNVPSMHNVTLPDELITTSSTYFRIESRGIKDRMMKGFKTIIERQNNTITIFSWEALL